MLEPCTIQEAKDMTAVALEVSREFKCFVMLRSYTRLSHASGPVQLGEIRKIEKQAWSDSTKSITPYLAKPAHAAVLEKLALVEKRFEKSPFNAYEGPETPGIAHHMRRQRPRLFTRGTESPGP